MKKLDLNTIGVMIIPGDMPFIEKDDLIKIQNKFFELDCKKVICPKYNNISGNPVLLPKSYFNILKKLNDDNGAKSYIKDKDIAFVETSSGTLFDIDTVESLNKANLYQ